MHSRDPADVLCRDTHRNRKGAVVTSDKHTDEIITSTVRQTDGNASVVRGSRGETMNWRRKRDADELTVP